LPRYTPDAPRWRLLASERYESAASGQPTLTSPGLEHRKNATLVTNGNKQRWCNLPWHQSRWSHRLVLKERAALVAFP
jgi:hypothetical protein